MPPPARIGCAPGLALGLTLAASVASAGPPLVSDDPNAAPPGELQWISALVATERGPDATLDGFVMDLAWGLAPGLELDAILEVIAADHEKDDDGAFERSGVPFSGGVKWEPVRTETFSLALAPRLAVDLDGGDLAGVFPLLLELRRGRFRVGTDSTWTVRENERDGAVVGLYSGLGVGTGSELLAELFLETLDGRSDPELGFNLGVDWALADRVHLLASGGTGLRGGAGPRREWNAYLGLQLFLHPFEPAPPGPSLPASSLLELTNRQVSRSRASGGLYP